MLAIYIFFFIWVAIEIKLWRGSEVPFQLPRRIHLHVEFGSFYSSLIQQGSNLRASSPNDGHCHASIWTPMEAQKCTAHSRWKPDSVLRPQNHFHASWNSKKNKKIPPEIWQFPKYPVCADITAGLQFVIWYQWNTNKWQFNKVCDCRIWVDATPKVGHNKICSEKKRN